MNSNANAAENNNKEPNNIDTIKNNENENIDYDQDIISAQDVESGKDITDITDVEKDDKCKKEKEKFCRQTINFKKKKFRGEENDDDIIDADEVNRLESNCKRIVAEKSPKERFARFDEELGCGAFKRVYRGYDYDTGREIAWNAVNVSCLPQDSISKIQDEIAIIKKLKHPNIINFVSGFCSEEKKEEIVIITEIFTSGSLKQHLNKIKHPRLKVIKFWCKEILKGLKYMHEFPTPIIHRDIKCDNIFINSTTSEIKIGDLGYSCILKNNEHPKSVSGTPEFMAPEVLTGRYGVLADIYSFGMCVLEIVTREKPYKECENNLIEIFDRLNNHILPKSIEKVRNLRLLEFIKSCLKPEMERPSANDLLNSEFLNDLEHEENNYAALMYPPVENATVSNTNLNSLLSREPSRNGLDSIRKSSKWGKAGTIGTVGTESINTGSNLTTNFNSNIESYNREIPISPFEIAKNEGNKTFMPFNGPNKNLVKTNIKSPSNTNEIVGLRKKSMLINTDNINSSNLTPSNNTTPNNLASDKSGAKSNSHFVNVNNFKTDHFQYHYHSSSDDLEESSPIKEFNEKYHYDQAISKPLVETPHKDSIHHHYTNQSNPFKFHSSNTTHTINCSNFNKQPVIPNPFTTSSLRASNTRISGSKIEIRIEEEYKDENKIKISLVKKKKNPQKKISFDFDLNTDTCEKILKELESVDIGLNDEDKKIIKLKLSSLIRNYTNSIGNSNVSYPSLNESKDQFMDSKVYFDKFFKKVSKLVGQCDELLQVHKQTKLELLKESQENKQYDDTQLEFIEKTKILEELTKIVK